MATVSEPAPTDVHAPYVRELIDARDWAGLVRYWIAHQYPPALGSAIDLVQGEVDLASFLTAVRDNLFDSDDHSQGNRPRFDRRLPEDYLTALPQPQRMTLDLLLLYPQMALCETAGHYPLEQQQHLIHTGLESSERSCQLAQTLQDRAYDAFCRIVMARGYWCVSRQDEARTSCEQALDIYRDLAEWRPDVYRTKVAATLSNLSILQRHMDDLEEARDSCQEALEIHRALAHTQPDSDQSDVATALSNLGIAERDLEEYEAARVSFEEALGIFRTLAQAQPDTYRFQVATGLNNLGAVQRDLNELEAAQANFQEALVIERELARLWPDAYRAQLAMTLNNLGIVHRARNDPDAARNTYTEILGIYRELAETLPDVHRPNVARALVTLGHVERDRRDLAAARAHIQEAMEIYMALTLQQPPAYAYLEQVEATYDLLAELDADSDDPEP